MMIYRLVSTAYQDDLSGTGSKLFGGRWNVPGYPAIYTAQNISLAVLEILVNTDKNHIPPGFCLMKIQLPESLPRKIIDISALKPNWYRDFEYTQYMGTQFLRSGKEAVLQVPSAIVQEEYNLLLNPLHSDFKKITVKATTAFEMDIRLMNKHE